MVVSGAPDVDRQRLEALMRAHSTDILRLCFLYLNDYHLAEDAMQETFLKAFRALHAFRGEASEKTWLTRIAINVCKDLLKSRWFRFVERGIRLEDLPEEGAEFDIQDDTLVRAVMRLPRRYKEAVLLCFYQNFPAKEAAEALHLSPSALYARLNKAKRLLKTDLEGWVDHA